MGKTKVSYDFCGYVTKYGVRCSDGRTIKHGAFAHYDGRVVPCVWQHMHNSPANVLGNVSLEHRDDGVYGYVSLNDTEAGKNARILVQHGDITSMSIFANHLRENVDGSVTHGELREVSLVMAGANPYATIEDIAIAHADGTSELLEDAAVIFMGEKPIMHKDSEKSKIVEEEVEVQVSDPDSLTEDSTVEEVINSFNDVQKRVLYALVEQAAEEGATAAQSDISELTEDSTIEEVIDSLNDIQSKVFYATVAAAADEGAKMAQSDMEGKPDMKKHVFDQYSERTEPTRTLSHIDEIAIFKKAHEMGSLKKAFLAHSETASLQHADNGTPGVDYGISNIDVLFPDAQTITSEPELRTRSQEWVEKVLGGARKTPFARVKMLVADATADAARARGHKKGTKKLDELISMARREVNPATVYKKQRIDHADLQDITSFDVVTWMKKEMQLMTREEIARAILIGDGRSAGAEDKINESSIIPIAKEAALYKFDIDVNMSAADLEDPTKYEAVIDQINEAMADYNGSGSPTFFTSKKVLLKLKQMRDKIGRKLYETNEAVADALDVAEIVTVPVMRDVKSDSGDKTLLGIIVNMKDYNIGTNRGGEAKFFDDFDLNYNQEIYLYETRLSGALVKPDSAIAVWATTNP